MNEVRPDKNKSVSHVLGRVFGTLLAKRGENALGSLIRRPADSRAGHGSQHSGLQALEEALEALSPVEQLAPRNEAVHSSDLSVLSRATGLQHGLDNIHRCRKRSRETTSHRTSKTVCRRVVLLGGVHRGRYRLIGEELKRGERDRHRKRGWVGDVESAETLVLVDILGAIDHGAIHLGRVLDLHALLDDCVMAASDLFPFCAYSSACV